MAGKQTRIICKNIFKNGKNTTREQVTKKWIEMINQLEKRKKPCGDKRV